MANNNDGGIGKASPHTIKKFELVEKYIQTWVQKLMNNQYCNGVIFIDCMCNSGVYVDDNGETVYGTPIRVAKILRDAAWQYPNKSIQLYFNDYSEPKIELLKKTLDEQVPGARGNFVMNITARDGNELLKQIGPQLTNDQKFHYFLFYDPFQADIDWEALAPFFRFWGEVMINHMLSDPIRAIGQVKRKEKKEKYSGTYLMDDFEKLIPYGSDKTAYEKRVAEIINGLKGARQNYYVAAYPFFNRNNSLIYDLIHCTSNIEGFKLYKKTAWKTFGGKSSTKNTHGNENQMTLDMFSDCGEFTTGTDENCYYVQDITKYVEKHFRGQKDVPLEAVWSLLDEHPIFPSEGYRPQIKKELRETYGADVGKSSITFSDRR